MKIIGTVEHKIYICEVSHQELEKFLNLYYGNLKGPLAIGSHVDLTKGYNFAADAISAMKDTNKFIESNRQVVETILTGINVVEAMGYVDKPKVIGLLEKCKEYTVSQTWGDYTACEETDDKANSDIDAMLRGLKIT